MISHAFVDNTQPQNSEGNLFTSVSIAAVLFFLLSNTLVSGLTDSLMRDGSVLSNSRYTITQDALSTIARDDSLSVIGMGSSMTLKSLDGICIGELLENEVRVYNLAQSASRAYTDMVHIPRIVDSSPEIVLIEIGANLLFNTSESPIEPYIELRFKLDTMNQESVDIGGWIDLIEPRHREWVALNQVERMKFKQEYVPSAIEERLLRAIFDENTSEPDQYGAVPKPGSSLWNDYLQLPNLIDDSKGFDGMSQEKREEYNASKMRDSALRYHPSYRGSQSHAALDYEISTLLENNIRVIIISPPHHPSALTYVEDGQWDGLNETLARYAGWPGVTIFDQTWESGWGDDHFFDRNHLDDEGRIEFCHRLAPVIDQVLNE
jgi:hypothetical protein